MKYIIFLNAGLPRYDYDYYSGHSLRKGFNPFPLGVNPTPFEATTTLEQQTIPSTPYKKTLIPSRNNRQRATAAKPDNKHPKTTMRPTLVCYAQSGGIYHGGHGYIWIRRFRMRDWRF